MSRDLSHISGGPANSHRPHRAPLLRPAPPPTRAPPPPPPAGGGNPPPPPPAPPPPPRGAPPAFSTPKNQPRRFNSANTPSPVNQTSGKTGGPPASTSETACTNRE